MKLKPFIFSSLGFAFLGLAAWLFEILVIKGWYGLGWLYGSLYSPFILCFFAALSFSIPFALEGSKTRQILVLTSITYLLNLLCFQVGKKICYMLYCRFCMWAWAEFILILFISLLTVLFLGWAYWYSVHKLIKRNKKVNMLLISFSVVMSVPASLFTIFFIQGYGTGSDWIDAVKMGYPVFWCTFFLGLSGTFVSRQKALTSF